MATDTAPHALETDQASREASGARAYGRYLEEFEVGAVYKHWPAKTVTEADDHMFCLITMNHHPLHINDVYAAASQQGRNVVVGPLVYSLTLGMSVGDVSGKAIANLATEELKHPAPVFHGDTLFAESEVLEVTPSKSKGDRGVVKVRTDTYNQDARLWLRSGVRCSCPGALRGAAARPRTRPLSSRRRTEPSIENRATTRLRASLGVAGDGRDHSIEILAHELLVNGKPDGPRSAGGDTREPFDGEGGMGARPHVERLDPLGAQMLDQAGLVARLHREEEGRRPVGDLLEARCHLVSQATEEHVVVGSPASRGGLVGDAPQQEARGGPWHRLGIP